MNTDNFDIQRLVRNLIRIGTVSELDLERGRCRIATGGNLTDWLNWLTGRAGDARSWWAPSIGEQVLVLSLGGELETAFVLPGVFSDAHPAPSASAQAAHIAFPDGAVLEYEPATGALKAVGIKSATIEAAERITLTAPNITCIASGKITLDAPEVECTQQLTTGTIAIHQGGSMTGDLNHTGGSISSNGIVVHTHTHGGVQNGRGQTDKPA
ncbi:MULTISPECIES: phage baseplate assembly protein V [Serratia]|uniref:Phage baseplate assembly protein V n=1 Tax=Serratia marcescens TaxID=615 RepID=A0A2V4G6X1_SERMA|nr:MULTISPECIES: phage baseplate assembly protein V [Serratia]EJD6704968.1 phage baseplate assembly protein V [Serratia marcescens]EMB6252963.1 phage baseplate assembly protein V [Serratia marcescens]EME1465718.1 phage baseplate assembly protein V [Serratia marcescens]KFB58544.1 baseplate assembly protein [Serratia marcescens]MBH2855092.1 phage baseplate assembly protein V [Serratia marcescens]